MTYSKSSPTPQVFFLGTRFCVVTSAPPCTCIFFQARSKFSKRVHAPFVFTRSSRQPSNEQPFLLSHQRRAYSRFVLAYLCVGLYCACILSLAYCLWHCTCFICLILFVISSCFLFLFFFVIFVINHIRRIVSRKTIAKANLGDRGN